MNYQAFPSASDRRLLGALAVSLLIHLLLLDSPLEKSGGEQAAAPLAATLRRAAGVPDCANQSAAPVARRQETPLPVTNAVVAQPMVRETSADVPALSSASSATVAAPSVATAPMGSPVAAGRESAATTASVTATSAGLDADGLRQYRTSLSAEALRVRRYPVRAREAGWTGTVEIRVAVGADGSAQAPQLAHSSGHALIDEAALEMLARASQQTAVPDSLHGRAFSLLLPVEFKLDD